MKQLKLQYFLFSVFIVFAGILARINASVFPETINLYLGDALYAVMMFCLVGVVVPLVSTLYRGGLALAICWVIELSQLYKAPWIMSVRHTLPGKLILGNEFLWSDIWAYLLGVCVSAAIETGLIFVRKNR